MTVIAGDGAEEFHLFVFAPGLSTAVHAEVICPCHTVIHKVKAGIAAHYYHGGLYAEKIGKKLLAVVYAGKAAVVAHIHAVLVLHVRGAVQHIQHGHTDVKLCL